MIFHVHYDTNVTWQNKTINQKLLADEKLFFIFLRQGIQTQVYIKRPKNYHKRAK